MSDTEMSQKESYRVLRRAFSALDDQEIENFRHHLKRETPVLCGTEAAAWSDPRGSG